jgi:hypothetical protein
MYECVRISVYGSARGTVNLEYRDPLNFKSAVIYADMVYSTDAVNYECILYVCDGDPQKVAGGSFTCIESLNSYLLSHELTPLSNSAIKWPTISSRDIEVISATNADHVIFVLNRRENESRPGPVDIVEDFQDRFMGALEHTTWPIED